MKHIFWLSGENVDLGMHEALNLFNIKDFELNDRALIVDKKIDEKKLNRLAYTKKVYRYLFECSHEELFENLEKFNWSKIYKGNFAVRFENENKKRVSYEEKHLAPYIWHAVKRPKVNLKDPKTPIEFLFSDNNIYCGLLLHKNEEKFSKRIPHLRPGFHPSSLNPKLARACVNLLGDPKEIIDPFCGSGGILIEAGLMGIRTEGYDIEEGMLDKCKKNLKHFKIKNYKLKNKNALDLDKNMNYVITDLPYGKNTKGKNIKKTHKEFMKKLKKKLKRNAVVIFPHFVNYRKMIKDNKLKIDKEFEHYVHKGLTKKVVLIKK